MFQKIKKYFEYDHRKYENILDSDNKIWVFLRNFIFGLVIFFAFTLIFESVGHHEKIFYKELFYIDAFISTVFALEYIYRLIRARNKIKFIFNPMRIIDLLSFLPFFLGIFAAGDFLKILRLLRIFRILRVLKRIPLTNEFIKALKDYKEEYRAVFILFLVILFVGSFFVYFSEKYVPNTDFKNLPITFWWGLVTMSTVWYWDMVPTTNLWRIFASILVFLWPLIYWLASAITVMVFAETIKIHETKIENRRWKVCPRCEEKNPKSANYCMKCWKKLD